MKRGGSPPLLPPRRRVRSDYFSLLFLTPARSVYLPLSPAGTFPTTLSQLTSLQNLNLCYNGFTGTFPSLLLALPSLTALDLHYTSVSGPLPLAVGLGPALKYLDARYMSLSSTIPDRPHALASSSPMSSSRPNRTGSRASPSTPRGHGSSPPSTVE